MSEPIPKTALITGASSGIGAEFAREYARRGYNLLLTGRRQEKLETISRETKSLQNIEVEQFILELGDDGETDKLAETIRNRNDIEILVNNAGFGYNNYFHESDIAQQETMLRVHISAPLKLIHAVLPQMLNRNKGAIINVSSLVAWIQIPGSSTYSASKLYLKQFTENLKVELMDTDIKFQVLAPGLTQTDFHKRVGMEKPNQKNKGLARWMSAQKVVQTSLNTLSRNKTVIIPGFNNRLIIFLLKLIPEQLRIYLATKASRKMK